jgi:hypothetical protein
MEGLSTVLEARGRVPTACTCLESPISSEAGLGGMDPFFGWWMDGRECGEELRTARKNGAWSTEHLRRRLPRENWQASQAQNGVGVQEKPRGQVSSFHLTQLSSWHLT